MTWYILKGSWHPQQTIFKIVAQEVSSIRHQNQKYDQIWQWKCPESVGLIIFLNVNNIKHGEWPETYVPRFWIIFKLYTLQKPNLNIKNGVIGMKIAEFENTTFQEKIKKSNKEKVHDEKNIHFIK